METHERIRELRKNYLHLSQTEFGDKLGVSRSVIKNIELNALARPDQKLSLMKLMCKEFGVSEEWLLNGTEPMFAEPDTFSLDSFVRSHGMTDLELEILKTYFEIDPDTRRHIMDHFRSRFETAPAAESTTGPDTVAAAEAAYIKSRSEYVKKKVSSASSSPAGDAAASSDDKKASNQ